MANENQEYRKDKNDIPPDKKMDKIHTPEGLDPETLNNIMSALKIHGDSGDGPKLTNSRLIELYSQKEKGKPVKNDHKFWDTQPVTKFAESVKSEEIGPIDANNDVENVLKTPYPLPDGFEWVVIDIFSESDRERVYTLLNENYVEDDDNLFRFDYKAEFLIWALTPPGYNKDWHIGVMVSSSKRLVGFITGIPVTLSIMDKKMDIAEINFLCVHKKLRSKRLAPVLIKEITRRINLCGIWQAVYTAGILIPKPIAKCRYWHRPLDIKKLVDARFSGIGDRMTMSRAIRLYRVPDVSEDLRPMENKDVCGVHKLLKTHLEKYKIHQVFTPEEVKHIFLPKDEIIYTYVKSIKGSVTDIISFYSLPSSVIKNPKLSTIRAAYSYYNISTTIPYKKLIENAISLAKSNNFDVYNALDLMENKPILEVSINIHFNTVLGSKIW
ncbi:N-myristoyl transferase, putative [Theileria equi strain WA]|uniref:Glycylpeptide N-tetradecanoyltransferase n=1 Tax=Theileria equi strain WA TaxID=1537102 RepID=L0AVN9_THEEQ|nr:N-myristoyl transferase, putative [Theileria equi strain WA]AFZ78944.1 N-myristoyl transferase, putative [Theileria equi strain WA]|eukprot:XP_004828610.1 N-myristoyl transferase, putative [Theileria equi strain WA]